MRQAELVRRLSFIVPFTLREEFVDTDNWRIEVNKDCNMRFLLLLKSFLRMFCQGDLDEFIIVCPASQCPAVRDLVSSATVDRRYIVVPELDLAPGIDLVLHANAEGRGGWYAQQVIKLAAHRVVRTPYYVVLDSDLVCIRPCHYSSFVTHDRILLNTETIDDYTRLYSDALVAKEVWIKSERQRKSLQLLGMEAAELADSRFYGETPVIFSAQHVGLMLRKLEYVHRGDWTATLARHSGWTEYGLYFGYLDALGLSAVVYRFAGPNAVLSLDKSVWQETSCYRTKREYDQAHFFGDDKGIFIAIQSWIPTAQWLPLRYSSRHDFYCDVERWLINEYPGSLTDSVSITTSP